jgi:hypothetical protein
MPTKRKTLALYPAPELEKRIKQWMKERGLTSNSAALCQIISEYLEENSFTTLSGRIKSIEQRLATLENIGESF